MKSIPVLLSSLALLGSVSAQSPSEEFDQYCPQKNNVGSKDLGGGRILDWQCHIQPTGSSSYDGVLADSPEACADACQNNADGKCRHATWLYSTRSCRFYDTDGETKTSKAQIYLSISGGSNPPAEPPAAADCKQDQDNLATCLESKTTIQGQLDQCKKDNTLTTSQTQNKLDKCEKDLTKAQQQEDKFNKLVNDLQLCPGEDKKTRTVGKTTYTLYCNQGFTNTKVLRTEDRFFDDCLQACDQEPRCQGVNYWPKNAERCVMMDQYKTDLSGKALGEQFIGVIPIKAK